MDVEIFDFVLPERLIALRPARPRDAAKLLVVHENGSLEHRIVSDLPDILTHRDVLVANDTKVIHGRLEGRRLPRPGKAPPGPGIEITLHRRLSADTFKALAKPARKLAVGDRVVLATDIGAEVVACGVHGDVTLTFDLAGSALDAAIEAQGRVPLPPYIAGRRAPDGFDVQDYQTVFSREAGSAAAPTAGLHFTDNLLSRLASRGICQERVTLHVGTGTFLPVTAADTDNHRMHAEHARLTLATADRLNAARASGGRCVAVGTTSLRTLESAASPDGELMAFEGETDIFITPGYRFRAADLLLTNFHLPRSTLFMLVCAFAGTETMKRAYAEAIANDYRFYSYGDACLLVRATKPSV